MRWLKGQYGIIENVILFSIGLIILTVSFSIFNLLNYRIVSETTNDQFSELGLYIGSAVLQAAGQGRFFDTATIFLDVPKRVSNQLYEINLTHSGIKIISSEAQQQSLTTLYNANVSVVNTSGFEISGNGALNMLYTQSRNQITVLK